MDAPLYEMSINLNVLNHLGLNLYSNVPAVLSEVVANSWDADAQYVNVEITPSQIAITDDGHGMTFKDLNEKYLQVGYERRKHDCAQSPINQRPVMGRKGIGKLSLFSIADSVEIQSVKGEEKNGFVMSAEEIRNQIGRHDGTAYHPEPLPADKIVLDKDGTRIILTELRKLVSQVPGALRKRLARRFSIIGSEYNFKVSVNDMLVEIKDRDYFHKLQYLWYYGKESAKYSGFCNSDKLEHQQEREGGINAEVKEHEQATRYQGRVGSARLSARATLQTVMTTSTRL